MISYYTAILIVWCVCSVAAPATQTTIRDENKLPGTRNWWQPDTTIVPIAQGFSTKFSYTPGDTVKFKLLTTQHITSYRLDIFRLGYYDYNGGRLMGNVTVHASAQPPCMFESSSRLVDCSNWEVSAQWRIPADSVSGIYVALPRRKSLYGTYIPFVVKQPPHRIASDLLFKTSDMTWLAYNRYGKWDLYAGNGSVEPSSRATKVSYNRPWQNRSPPPAGHIHNFLLGAEFAMLLWLEKQGYDVSYCSCQDIEDMHRDSVLVPSAASHRAPPYKVLLSVGHDEYWTQEMKNAFEHARENGVHLAFFSGNEVFWRVMWDENTQAAHTNYKALGTNVIDSRKHTRGSHHMSTSSRRDDAIHTVRRLSPAQPREQEKNKGKAHSHRKPHVTTMMLDEATQQWKLMDRRRIIMGGKESMENSAPAAPSDWTGTFRDPRHRPPDDESLLTGQWFMVNGHRQDALKVTREDATLRFWRDTSFYGGRASQHSPQPVGNTTRTCAEQRLLDSNSEPADDIVYVSENGLIGYEWDAFPTFSRPPGLIPLSTTHVNVVERLVQNFGSSYSGSGVTTHRLSLYRHYSQRPPKSVRTYPATLDDACKANYSALFAATTPGSAMTSLVFGAGTIQWSWALSHLHDGGPTLTEDRDLEQATLNLFADMDTFPTTLRSSPPNIIASLDPNDTRTCSQNDLPLVFPSSNLDTSPPTSTISSVELKVTSATGSNSIFSMRRRSKSRVLQVSGTAMDVGGHVAAVEVSLNGGRTWHMATGRKHWTFTHELSDVPKQLKGYYKPLHKPKKSEMLNLDKYREELYSNHKMYSDGNIGESVFMLVMSRAVDDSAWIEQVDVMSAFCQKVRGDDGGGPYFPTGRGQHILAQNSILVEL